MKYKFLKYVFLILPLFVNEPIKAQNPRFESYNILEDRRDLEVNAILQDKKGYVWLGTNSGLFKYDGVDFKKFTTSDSLYSNKISTLHQDPQERIWIGHFSGKISYMENGMIIKFNPEEGLPKDEISSFFSANDSILWFTTYGEGIYNYKGENRKRLYNISTGDGLLDNYVYTVTQNGKGDFYMATDQGISIYNFKKDSFVNRIAMKDGLPDNIVKDLIIINENLWIGMEDGGICKYDLETNQFTYFSDWHYGSINNFVYYSDNEIWISTKRNGIIKFQPKSENNIHYSHYDENLGLSDSRTNTIFLDREKNIWIGTKSGLSIRKNNHFTFLNEKDGFDINHIFNFTIDNAGKYWVASQKGLYRIGFSKMGVLQKEKLFTNTPYESISFISLYKDNEGYIWSGTYGYGVFRINPESLDYTRYTTEDGLTDNNVINITGKNKVVWFSTLGGGISKFSQKNNEFKNYTVNNGLTSNYIYSIFIDSQDRKWISTDGGGVMYLKNGKLEPFSDSSSSFDSDLVYQVTEDIHKNLWFNTGDNALVGYTGERFIFLNNNNGLKTSSIQSLLPDEYGNLIIVSNEGVDKYNVSDSSFEYNGENDGVAHWEPNLNSFYKDSNGNMWIGTNNGLIKYDAKAAGQIQVKPKIFITQKMVNFEEANPGKRNFRYNENHITFYYNALWYQSSGELTYRYKLKGYDLNWSPESSVRMTRYSNLPPGNYEFVVQVKYAGGKWIESPESRFSFIIKPPFWKTTWFIISAIILLLVGIYVFIQLRVRKLRKDRDRLEEEVRKRTAEIQRQKEEIETQRDEIEAQRDNVVQQRNQIEKQNKEITSSIHYASRIQNAVLPPETYLSKFLGEHFILFKPRDIVSGDFYYLNTKYDKVIVAAADCTGHGVPGAFMSMLGTSLLNHILSQLENDFTAGEILTKLRDEVKNALRQSQDDSNQSKDGMDISLVVFRRGDRNINYAGAYNPLTIVRNKEIIRHKGDPMPIGIHIKEKEHFTDHEVKVQEDDMVYLYSDGYQDQFGGEHKKKFLPKNLRTKLVEIADKPVAKQKELLNQSFEDWRGDNSQIDDVLVIGFRI